MKTTIMPQLTDKLNITLRNRFEKSSIMDGKGDLVNQEETANSVKNSSMKRQGQHRYVGSRHRAPCFSDVSQELEIDEQLLISQGYVNRLLDFSAKSRQSPNITTNETEIEVEKYKLPELGNGSSAVTRNLEGVGSQ